MRDAATTAFNVPGLSTLLLWSAITRVCALLVGAWETRREGQRVGARARDASIEENWQKKKINLCFSLHEMEPPADGQQVLISQGAEAVRLFYLIVLIISSTKACIQMHVP